MNRDMLTARTKSDLMVTWGFLRAVHLLEVDKRSGISMEPVLAPLQTLLFPTMVFGDGEDLTKADVQQIVGKLVAADQAAKRTLNLLDEIQKKMDDSGIAAPGMVAGIKKLRDELALLVKVLD